MIFGNFECYALDFGEFWLDGGIAFGLIPKQEWEKKIAVDDLNRIRLKTRSLLIKGEGRNILVDTGFGNKLTPEQKDFYGIQNDPVDINLMLSGFDLDVHQITDVVLTHLHLDHAGGSTVRAGNRTIPTFPNATYHVQAEQWEEGCSPHERDMESYLADDFLPLNSARQLNVINGSIKLLDGLEIMVTYGHTVAQQHVVVRGLEQGLFFCADLIPTVNHIPVHWCMAYDNRPLDFFPEKDYFLRKAIREKWILFFQHDPEIVAATVKEGETWIEFDQEVVFD